MKSKQIADIISYLFILLFTYAAVSKLLDVEQFVLQIGQSPLLYPYAKPLAMTVPAIELIISALLIVERYRVLAFYASFTLMTIFTLYIAAILQFSGHVPCACGGVLSMLGWKAHLVFNIVFVLLAVAGVLLDRRKGNNHSREIAKHPLL